MNNELPKRNSFLWIIIVVAVILIGIGVWFLLGNNVNVATDTIINFGEELLIEYPILEDYENIYSSEYTKTYNKDDVEINVSTGGYGIEKYFKKHDKFSQEYYEEYDEYYSNVQISETKELKVGERICYYKEVSYDFGSSSTSPMKDIYVCSAIGEEDVFEVKIELSDKEMSVDSFKTELATLFDIKCVDLISELISENSVVIDNKNIVEYKVPEELKKSSLSSNKYRYYSKDNIDITIHASHNSKNCIEYLSKYDNYYTGKYYSNTKISEIKEMKMGNKECYYRELSYDYNALYSKYHKNIMYICTKLTDEIIYEVEVECEDEEMSTYIMDILNKLLEAEVKPIK